MDTITINCCVVGTHDTFSVEIDRNKNIIQLKDAIKEKKITEFYNVDSDKLNIWKVEIREIGELNNLILHNDDQLRGEMRKISSYFTDEPLHNYIHLIVRPPLPPFRFDVTCKMGLLSEGSIVEYLEEDCIHKKATLCEGCLCTKDGKYNSFTKFIRDVKKLKPKEKVRSDDFHNLKINGMSYWEVREKLYKLYFGQEDEEEDEGNLIILFNRNKRCDTQIEFT